MADWLNNRLKKGHKYQYPDIINQVSHWVWGNEIRRMDTGNKQKKERKKGGLRERDGGCLNSKGQFWLTTLSYNTI